MELVSFIEHGHLWAFFILVIGIIALPGSDMAFVIGNTLAGGRTLGGAAITGIVMGGVAHSIMAYFGIGLILQTVPGAFSVMLFVGAIYLAWIGFQLFKRMPATDNTLPMTTRSRFNTMLQGMVTCLLNPKAYFFMFAIYPQFIQPERGSFGLQIILLSSIIAAAQIAIYGASAWSMSKLTSKLNNGRSLETQLSRAMGLFLIVISILSLARVFGEVV